MMSCTLTALITVFQYDDAFIPRKLSNWESPKLFDEVRIEYLCFMPLAFCCCLFVRILWYWCHLQTFLLTYLFTYLESLIRITCIGICYTAV